MILRSRAPQPACGIVIYQKGRKILIGAKPPAFMHWILDILNAKRAISNRAPCPALVRGNVGVSQMSKRETPMTQRYWERVRGTLLEEYLIVRSSPGVGRRMIDAVIIEDGDHRIASHGETVSLDGHDIVVVQTKVLRLGMYRLGQAF